MRLVSIKLFDAGPWAVPFAFFLKETNQQAVSSRNHADSTTALNDLDLSLTLLLFVVVMS